MVLALSATMAVAGGFQDLRPGSDQALVLEVGRSLILRFEGMTRVAITHHEIADVSVASTNELIIVADPLGKGKTGNTMLYVWDKNGIHKFAVTVVGLSLAEGIALDLQKVLGPSLSARAMSDAVVVIEGQVADKVALDNLDQLAEASATDDVQVVAMASAADGGDVSPAARAANALTSILDPSLKATAWGEDVVVVEGELPTAEQVMQARGAISAFGEDLKIVDMITVRGETLASQAPVAQIQKMLGPDFRVTQLR
ncbi:MAG: pilus assembly protein N-terminal domain-containing protein, partial [Chloroflexota bacterium]|nr:pilus assembly protein N-terminal domain-containing protein [Chloroflexota bacterium]